MSNLSTENFFDNTFKIEVSETHISIKVKKEFDKQNKKTTYILDLAALEKQWTDSHEVAVKFKVI